MPTPEPAGAEGARPDDRPRTDEPRIDLSKYAWMSIAAAIATIALKMFAWWITQSVGLLSDAAESCVNLVAAVVALIAIKVAAKPADKNHHYGHSKAEYFSAAIEGQMIFIAAVVIIYTSVERFLNPAPIDNTGLGLGISVVASLINGGVALILLRAGKEHRSMTLTADGKHLMTDVVTSAGVLIGVALVVITGIDRLDPVVAFLVGLNIIWTGWKLLAESISGLMDISLTKEDNAALAASLERFVTPEVDFHALRTRVSGHAHYAEVHVLVPGSWTVQEGHDLIDEIEHSIALEHPGLVLSCHIEPREDPRAYGDYSVQVPVRSHADITGETPVVRVGEDGTLTSDADETSS